MVYAVIQVKGTINTKPDTRKTLRLLRLTRTNHCVLIEENDTYKGMLQIAKDFITWGEINKETLTKLITSRGKITGDKGLTDDYIKSTTSFQNIEKLAQALADNKFKYRDIPKIKPIFRLHPPKKGHTSVKRPFKQRGALGYRGADINKLIAAML